MKGVETIHVALCADEGFALPMGVCLTSLLENNKKNKIHVHILTIGFSQKTIERITATSQFYNQTIDIHLIDDGLFEGHPLSTTFPQSIYFRYLLPSIVDESVKQIIYIDSDTIILKDISNLYNQELVNYAIGAVPDANTDDIVERNRIGIYEGPYLNSGVLLINLEYWRQEKVFGQLTEFILKNPEKCRWPDQDALNVVLHNKIKWLSFSYNFQLALIGEFDRYRMHRNMQKDVVNAFSSICILHYSSWSKPWVEESRLPLTFVWRYYHKLSIWRNVPLKTRGLKYKIKLRLGLVNADNSGNVNPLFATAMTMLYEKYN